MAKWKIGDWVVTPDGDVDKIDAIRKMPSTRDGRKPKNYYHVKSSKPGSPVEWWRAKQLQTTEQWNNSGYAQFARWFE